jgi:hypothetical protein
MKPSVFLLIIIGNVFFACEKRVEKVIYNGEVVSQPNYCTSSTGFPFIIRYSDKFNSTDSIITVTLPTQYKFLGQKIKFELQNLTSQDERIACTNLYNIPRQAIIFNVLPQ